MSQDAANPLVIDGVRWLPSVTRTFSASRPLFVYLQAYEHDATAMRPLAAYLTFYQDGARVWETDPIAVTR